MINKEERAEKQLRDNKIENAKTYLLNYRYENKVSEAIDILMGYILNLEADNYEQNNIINNYIEQVEKLEKELEHYKNIVAGKTIQDIGLSDIYKGD